MLKWLFRLFAGRINVWTYIFGVAFYVGAAFAQIIILPTLYQIIRIDGSSVVCDVVSVIYNCLLIVFYWSIYIRRIHDTSIDEWYMSWLVFSDSYVGENKWGKPTRLGVDLRALIGV